mgnify:CR=1 FL=1
MPYAFFLTSLFYLHHLSDTISPTEIDARASKKDARQAPTLLGNLLDNAIEACERLPDNRVILFKMVLEDVPVIVLIPPQLFVPLLHTPVKVQLVPGLFLQESHLLHPALSVHHREGQAQEAAAYIAGLTGRQQHNAMCVNTNHSVVNILLNQYHGFYGSHNPRSTGRSHERRCHVCPWRSCYAGSV